MTDEQTYHQHILDIMIKEAEKEKLQMLECFICFCKYNQLNFFPDCYICIALSKYTHIDQHRNHLAILHNCHVANIWPFDHICKW